MLATPVGVVGAHRQGAARGGFVGDHDLGSLGPRGREWIAEHDAEHLDWKDRARAKRENYTTYTNAGYEVLIRTAEAMEQMKITGKFVSLDDIIDPHGSNRGSMSDEED